jgi:predicted O-methyltransferase YrrM
MQLKTVVRRTVPAAWRRSARQRLVDRRLERAFGVSRDELGRAHVELEQVFATVALARDAWLEEVTGAAPGGKPHLFGGVTPVSATRLYAVLRNTRPDLVVETGVCNGVSSAVILAALEHNGRGRLYSVDFPEFSDGTAPGEHWEGKLGAVVPAGKQPGWLIPPALRDRWELTVGRSQDMLPPLLDRLGTIDVFIHDSEHSYECMRFEFGEAEQHLRSGGLLVADDAGWNTAFDDYVREAGLSAVEFGDGMLATRVGGAGNVATR